MRGRIKVERRRCAQTQETVSEVPYYVYSILTGRVKE